MITLAIYSGFQMYEEKKNQHTLCWERGHLARRLFLQTKYAVIGIVTSLALLFFSSLMIAAKPEHQAKTPDMNEVKKAFIETFGQDFDLVSGEVREKDGGKYWLAVVRAKKSGTFIFRHKFEMVNYGYRYHDTEFRVIVGERGCSRTLYTYNTQLFCIGDSVIIPVVIGDNVIDHTFSRVSRFDGYSDGPTEIKLDERKVDNSAGDHLRYIGRQNSVAVHRSFKEASVGFAVFFEAVAPGRFSISLSPHIPGRMQHYPGEPSPFFVTSIIVVPKESSVTGLIERVATLGTNEKSDNPRASSAGGGSFQTSVFMLRPGDRIGLIYGATRIPNNPETQALVEEVEPMIKVLPFSIEERAYYNEWIIDHVLR